MPIRTTLAAALIAATPFAASADWSFDPSHTSIKFEVSHLGFSDTVGFFETFAGDVTFDPQNIEATEASFTIDAASINTLFGPRDEHLRSADFLDVENHPEITFLTTGVTSTSDTTAVVTGEMTLRGVTREVRFDAVLNNIAANPFNPAQAIAGFTVTGEVDRTAFGVDMAAPVVGAVLRVTINTELTAPVELLN